MSGRWWGVITESAVPELAAAILDPARRRPIIVVTTTGYTDPEHIPRATRDEADELRSAVGDIADVAIVATGDVSFALEAALPDHWHIFSGACRSYPAGVLADPDIRRSPLRRRRHGEVASEQVIGDALGHAHAAGVFEQKPKGGVATTGTVKGFLNGEQALVDVGALLPAIVWRDMTSPGIPLDWVVARGATVPGELDRDRNRNRFILRKRAFGPDEFLDTFPHESVTLALVGRVTADRAVLRVHPDLAITVHRTDVSSNPLDVLDLFFVEGEVVRVRAVHLSTGKPHLRLIDVDGDEPVVPPVAIVEGGTPWLAEGRSLPSPSVSEATSEAVTAEADATTTASRDAPQPATEEPGSEGTDDDDDAGSVMSPAPTTGPVPGPGPRPSVPLHPHPSSDPAIPPTGDNLSAVQSMSMKITALNAEIQRLRRETTETKTLRQDLEVTKRTLRDVRAELGHAQESITNFRDLHKKAVEELRRTRRTQPTAKLDGPRERREHWPSDEMWLRHEIELAWIERVPRVDKLRLPRPSDYAIGPRFAESLASLNDGQFDKAMKCVVDVLTDRAKDLASRDLHRLRSGDGGSDAPRVRPEDGAVAWRAAIEVNAPSARRLHYWATGNRIELSRVGIHDDMEA